MIYRRFFKRPLDVLLSALALVVLSPVLAVVAVLVRVKLGAPVVFRQECVGKGDFYESIFEGLFTFLL